LRVLCLVSFLLIISASVPAQEQASRGSIPEELLRPGKGEVARYPIDTVIGELGRGTASQAAYSFAGSIAAGFLSGEKGHPSLAVVNSGLRENYLSILETIEPGSYRIGGGKEEADGAVSFMIRFIGRESAITGELFIKYVTKQVERVSEDGEEESAPPVITGSWVFDDLILEEAKTREEEQREHLQRFDFSPYERFF